MFYHRRIILSFTASVQSTTAWIVVMNSLKKKLVAFFFGFYVCIFLTGTAFPQNNFIQPKEYKGSDTQNSVLMEKSREVFQNASGRKETSTQYAGKVSSDILPLLDAEYLPQGISLPDYINSMESFNQFHPYIPGFNLQEKISEGTLNLYIYFKSDDALNLINSLSQSIVKTNTQFDIAVANVKVKNITALASDSRIVKMRTVNPPNLNSGTVVTEGDSIHQTAEVRSTYGDNGTGIKVGLISDGVDSRSTSQATGDLPQDGSGLTVLSNSYGGDEGTAMLETMYDMVPGADFYFHDLGGDIVSFMSAVDNLVNAGCNIICDDVAWITQPFFEDGPVAQHIDSLLNVNDILYVTPAGNNALSHYQGRFKKISGTSGQHDFSNGTSNYHYLYFNLPAGKNVSIVLQWNDRFGQSSNDYDLYLYSFSSSSFVAQSEDWQNGNDDPLETINYTATASTAGDFAIVVNKYSGSRKKLEVYFYLGGGYPYSNNISGSDAIFGHAALDSVITVGAVNYLTPDTIEAYSSLGPSTIKFPNNVTRNKPDVVAVDGTMITGAGGFGVTNGPVTRFYGTSASVAHVAGVLTQVWSNPQVTSGSQAKQYVLNYSNDEGASGYDNTFGYGIINSMNVYDSTPLPVELSSFTYKILSNGVKLNWVTQTEVNNYGFEIQKTPKVSPLYSGGETPSSGENWETLAFVEGHGNSNSPKYYSYTDEGVLYGNYLYRLKQIDNDGSYEYSNPVEVFAGEIPDKIVLEQNYPNPFNPSTKIKFAVQGSKQTTLKVYDILGNEIAELFNQITEPGGIYEVNFDGSELASGVYYSVLRSGEKVEIKKMMLMK